MYIYIVISVFTIFRVVVVVLNSFTIIHTVCSRVGVDIKNTIQPSLNAYADLITYKSIYIKKKRNYNDGLLPNIYLK